MRSLKREKRTLYISQPLPSEEIIDGDGNATGNYVSVFDEPSEIELNLKPITDLAERQAFGSDVKNILKAEFTPFDVEGLDVVEHSAAWIGVSPNGTLRDDNIVLPMNNNYTVEQVLDTGGQLVAYFKKKAGATKA